MSRYAIFGAQSPHAITPRLDPIGRERRLDPNAPVIAAYLGGRPVLLGRPDPATRRPGEPADLTVPFTISRFQHAMDIERGYDPRSWDPTPLVGLGVPAAVGEGMDDASIYLAIAGIVFGGFLIWRGYQTR